MKIAHYQMPDQEFPEWYTVSDPESGCKVRLVRDAGVGFSVARCFFVSYDDGKPFLQSEEQLRAQFPLPVGISDFRWVPFEMLRQHILDSHFDTRYLELAAR